MVRNIAEWRDTRYRVFPDMFSRVNTNLKDRKMVQRGWGTMGRNVESEESGKI